MKIWEALKVWFVKIFGTAIIGFIAYRKGQKKYDEAMEANYKENQDTKKKIKANLKNSPKYRKFFEKMMLFVALMFLSGCSTLPDFNKNYCDLYTVIKYQDGDIINLLTEYQVESNNLIHADICSSKN